MVSATQAETKPVFSHLCASSPGLGDFQPAKLKLRLCRSPLQSGDAVQVVASGRSPTGRAFPSPRPSSPPPRRFVRHPTKTPPAKPTQRFVNRAKEKSCGDLLEEREDILRCCAGASPLPPHPTPRARRTAEGFSPLCPKPHTPTVPPRAPRPPQIPSVAARHRHEPCGSPQAPATLGVPHGHGTATLTSCAPAASTPRSASAPCWPAKPGGRRVKKQKNKQNKRRERMSTRPAGSPKPVILR